MGRFASSLFAVVLVLATTPAMSQSDGGYGHGHMWGGAGWMLGPIFMILILASVAAIVYLIIRSMADKSQSPRPSVNRDEPMDILKMRYAKGEIDHDEYELRMQTLNKKGG